MLAPLPGAVQVGFVRNIEGASPATSPWLTDNFRLLRLLLALTIAATHSLWVVYGLYPPAEWPLPLYMQVAHAGVWVFFGISGYLICQSLLHGADLFRFLVARAVRLMPLLFIVSLVMAFVVGPFVTELSFRDYYGDWRLWAYVPATSFAAPDMTLPGVFVNAPAEMEVNVSLWTLRYELIAYIAMALLAGLGFLNGRLFAGVLGLAGAGYLAITFGSGLRAEFGFLDHGLKFGMAFLLGAMFYRYRALLPLRFVGVLGLVGLAGYVHFSAVSSALAELICQAALIYTALWFAERRFAWLSGFNRLGDYSYGLFVTHWPIAQVVLQFNPKLTYAELVFHVLPLSLLAAVLLWHGVEKPLLNRKAQIAELLMRLLQGLGDFALSAFEGLPPENGERGEQREQREPRGELRRQQAAKAAQRQYWRARKADRLDRGAANSWTDNALKGGKVLRPPAAEPLAEFDQPCPQPPHRRGAIAAPPGS